MTRVYKPRDYVHFVGCGAPESAKHRPTVLTGIWQQGQIISEDLYKNWWIVKPQHGQFYCRTHIRYMKPKNMRTWESDVPVAVWIMRYEPQHSEFSTPVRHELPMFTSPSGKAFVRDPRFLRDHYIGKTAFLTEEAAMRRHVGKLDKAAHSGYLRRTNPSLVAHLENQLEGAPKVYRGRTS